MDKNSAKIYPNITLKLSLDLIVTRCPGINFKYKNYYKKDKTSSCSKWTTYVYFKLRLLVITFLLNNYENY